MHIIRRGFQHDQVAWTRVHQSWFEGQRYGEAEKA